MAFLNQSGLNKLVSNTKKFVDKSIDNLEDKLEKKLVNDTEHISCSEESVGVEYPNVNLIPYTCNLEYSVKTCTIQIKADTNGNLYICPKSDTGKIIAKRDGRVLTTIARLSGTDMLIANDLDENGNIIQVPSDTIVDVELTIFDSPIMTYSGIVDVRPLFDVLDYVPVNFCNYTNVKEIELKVGDPEFKGSALNTLMIIKLNYSEEDKSQFWNEWSTKGWYKLNGTLYDAEGNKIENGSLSVSNCAFKLINNQFTDISLDNCYNIEITGKDTSVNIGYNCSIEKLDVSKVYSTIADWKTCTFAYACIKSPLYFNNELVENLYIYSSDWPACAFSRVYVNSLTIHPGVKLSRSLFAGLATTDGSGYAMLPELTLDNVAIGETCFYNAWISTVRLRNIKSVPSASLYIHGDHLYIPSTINEWKSGSGFSVIHVEDVEKWCSTPVTISPFSRTTMLYENDEHITDLDLSNIKCFYAHSIYNAAINKVIFSDKLKTIVSIDYLNQDIEISNLSSWCKVKLENVLYATDIKSISLNGTVLSEIIIPEDITFVDCRLFPKNSTIYMHENITEVVGCAGSYVYIYFKGLTPPKYLKEFSSKYKLYVPYQSYQLYIDAGYDCTPYDYENNKIVNFWTINYTTTDGQILTLPESDLDIVSHEYGKIIIKNFNNTLPDNAFNGCETLKSIDISDLYYIGNNCFANCSNFEMLSFKYVKTIGDNAFLNCNLPSVLIPSLSGGSITLGLNAFDGNPNLKLIMDYVDLETYKNAENWSSYADKMEFDNQVIKYVGGEGAFIGSDAIYNENGTAILKRGKLLDRCFYDPFVTSIILDRIPQNYSQRMPQLTSVYLNCPCSGDRQSFNYCVNGKRVYFEFSHEYYKIDNIKWERISNGAGYTTLYCKTEFPIDGEYWYEDAEFKTRITKSIPHTGISYWTTKFYVPFEYVEDYKLKWPWYADYIYGYDFNNE